MRKFTITVVAALALAVLAVTLLQACGGQATAPESTPKESTPPGSAAPDLGETEAASAEPAPPATSDSRPRAKLYVVARVIDGDTIELGNGDRVRLVQIDSPEVRESECFADEATDVLSAILPEGTKVRLVADPKLDRADRYDRLLRYIFEGKKNVNLQLVRRGAASVWFYEGDKGRYANALLKAAERAKKDGRGLWSACPGTVLDPSRAIDTEREPAPELAPPPEPAPASEAPSEPAPDCHSSYQGACLDPSVSDYDCAGGEGNGPAYTGPVMVIGPDDYDLDRDGDGYACEDS